MYFSMTHDYKLQDLHNQLYQTDPINATPTNRASPSVHRLDDTLTGRLGWTLHGDISAHCAALVADALAVHTPHHDNIVSLLQKWLLR